MPRTAEQLESYIRHEQNNIPLLKVQQLILRFLGRQSFGQRSQMLVLRSAGGTRPVWGYHCCLHPSRLLELLSQPVVLLEFLAYLFPDVVITR